MILYNASCVFRETSLSRRNCSTNRAINYMMLPYDSRALPMQTFESSLQQVFPGIGTLLIALIATLEPKLPRHTRHRRWSTPDDDVESDLNYRGIILYGIKFYDRNIVQGRIVPFRTQYFQRKAKFGEFLGKFRHSTLWNFLQSWIFRPPLLLVNLSKFNISYIIKYEILKNANNAHAKSTGIHWQWLI